MSIKCIGRQKREQKVLLGLIEYYIETGKPVGSNTLKETGFDDLSSATIRNYFVHLEQEGFLTQSHSSGGRIPTQAAMRLYAETYLDETINDESKIEQQLLDRFESKAIAFYLQNAAEQLSHLTKCAAFLSAPRFDHDFIVDIKLVPLDGYRCLSVLVTNFGMVHTEILQPALRLSNFSVKRIESYFRWRLKSLDKPEDLSKEEETLAQTLYNELLLRYIVGYSTFIEEDIYRTGFSHLLNYIEFKEATALASGLSLFENIASMRKLLKESCTAKGLKFWIGDDLLPYASTNPNCSVIVIPYYINQTIVGAIGVLGPTRLPYRLLFNTLKNFSLQMSQTLTRLIYKFKVGFRQPEIGKLYLETEEQRFIGQSRLILLEDQRV